MNRRQINLDLLRSVLRSFEDCSQMQQRMDKRYRCQRRS